jgi:hypothetical protein
MGLGAEMLREFLRGMGSVKAGEVRKSMLDADNLPTIC